MHPDFDMCMESARQALQRIRNGDLDAPAREQALTEAVTALSGAVAELAQYTSMPRRVEIP